jgi:hypothetical protein
MFNAFIKEVFICLTSTESLLLDLRFVSNLLMSDYIRYEWSDNGFEKT